MPAPATPLRLTDYPDNGTFRYFDTETTGLSAAKDRVISLGIVTVVNGKITDEKEWFFNPGNTPIDPAAYAVHGISMDFLRDKPRIETEIGEILGLVMDSVMAGHNVDFDLRFMDAECRRFKLPTFSQVMASSLCSMAMSKQKWPGKKAGLDFVLDRLKINRGDRVKHGALLDARLGAKALIGMGQKQMSMYDSIDNAMEINANATLETGIAPSILVIKATDTELADHESYIAGMEKEMKGTSVWTQLNALSSMTPEAAAAAVLVMQESGDTDDMDDTDLSAYADIEESAVPVM